MKNPLRRLTQLATGFVAVGAVATILLVPANSGQAATATSKCSVQLSQRDHALHDVSVATARRVSAVKAQRAAQRRFNAAPTRRHRHALRVARASARQALAQRTAAQNAYAAARARYATCMSTAPTPTPTPTPAVSVTNPRVEFYGSNFGVADVTWSNIPLGEYQYFLRYDDAPVFQYAVTFVDVVPPTPPFDPSDPFPGPETIYMQNAVTYTASMLGSGCDYTPGQNVTVELWTSVDGTSPAGVKVASATVDNPCN